MDQPHGLGYTDCPPGAEAPGGPMSEWETEMDALLAEERRLDKIGASKTGGKPASRVRRTAGRAARRAERKALRQSWAEYLADAEGGDNERLH